MVGGFDCIAITYAVTVTLWTFINMKGNIQIIHM